MEKLIRSADNPELKRIVRLGQRKYRDREGEYVVEGPNLVREALENGVEIRSVFLRAEAGGAGSCGRELEELVLSAKEKSIAVAGLVSELFDRACNTEHPQGIFAVVKRREWKPEEFFQNGGNVVILDRLQDPGNLGTILRTADAAGFQGAVLLKGCGDIYAPKVARAAAGSLFRLPVITVDAPEDAARLVKKYGKTLICTTLDCKKCYFESMMDRDIALIIGNEGNGVCQTLIDLADQCVTIPMAGSAESLNAGVAAGILMYEAVRQQRARDKIR